MAFPPQFLDELRNRLSIAEVIQIDAAGGNGTASEVLAIRVGT